MARSTLMPSADELLSGRSEPLDVDYHHLVLDIDMRDTPDGCEEIFLGMGCFWGAERHFWQLPGVVNTAVGYAGGSTPNPTYEEVCSGRTGHTEIVRVVYDPAVLPLAKLLKSFWEAHDPTQGMRQGNDIGTQYRSAVYGDEAQLAVARDTLAVFQSQLDSLSKGPITTELAPKPAFYFAETYHQQYLYKNPLGYCGLKGTGAVCPI
ncbi:peptide-methionine (S)-S-oxide reductase MsrA [Saccharospirillum mangrovi]|uniref:peptide-methionine (S)-S-oxide reductase MsrA n=1 Tax=Saccharospirillum mangrovi TaxID=2161747 RepID=UPI000D3A9932|nr:peptide-methionine (S)-S-oxide reductase MsrA [Saccharospirillum mangrovi]